jgi:serine/threonine-protein kinase
MGTVYRALHTALGRPAAVKVLRGGYADDPITVARFVREARAATRARHPRIVETFDFGHTPDGQPYMAMELVESATLQQRLKRGPVEALEAVLIARDIAEGLAAAHRVEVVHRDLKPANIFVDDRMTVKLCDFGAAKILDLSDDDLTRAGMTLGTPAYMSPEHITAKPLDGRADLYALGCVMFEMLSGKAPYRGDIRAVLNQHLQADVPAAESPDAALPAALVRVVKKAMAKDRRQRHATADAMIADLDFVAEELSRARGARRT